MNEFKQDNGVMYIIIAYLILSLIPMIFEKMYYVFNPYYISAIVFATILVRYRRTFLNKRTLLLACVFLFLQLLALTTSKLNISKEGLVLPVMYTLNFVSFFCLTYKVSVNEKGLVVFYQFYTYLCIYFCLYNMVVNFDIIINLLNMSGSLEGLMISSVFENRNGFAFILLWGVISTIYLQYHLKQKRYLLYLLFIMFNMLITFSRNSLLTVACFVLIFSWKFYKSKRINVIVFFLTLFVFGTGLLSIDSIYGIVVNALFRFGSGLSTREIVWQYFFESINIRTFLIGNGPGSTQEILKSTGFYSYHNSFMDLISTGGIVLMVAYVYILNLFLRKFSKLEEKSVLESSIFYAGMLSFQVYCLFESIVLQVGIGFYDIVSVFFLYLVPLLFLKSKSITEE